MFFDTMPTTFANAPTDKETLFILTADSVFTKGKRSIIEFTDTDGQKGRWDTGSEAARKFFTMGRKYFVKAISKGYDAKLVAYVLQRVERRGVARE